VLQRGQAIDSVVCDRLCSSQRVCAAAIVRHICASSLLKNFEEARTGFI